MDLFLDQIMNLKKRLKIVKEQESISQKLLEAEATNRLRHLEILRELSEVKSKIDEQLVDTDSEKQSSEKITQKMNHDVLNQDYKFYTNQFRYN